MLRRHRPATLDSYEREPRRRPRPSRPRADRPGRPRRPLPRWLRLVLDAVVWYGLVLGMALTALLRALLRALLDRTW
jgi:hypothetical protein